MPSNKKAVFRKKAQEDVDSIAVYIAEDNIEAAERFFEALEATCALLADMPQIGSFRIFDKEDLKEMRIIPVKQFEKYLIFYRENSKGIEVIRIIHGTRDLPGLFK